MSEQDGTPNSETSQVWSKVSKAHKIALCKRSLRVPFVFDFNIILACHLVPHPARTFRDTTIMVHLLGALHGFFRPGSYFLRGPFRFDLSTIGGSPVDFKRSSGLGVSVSDVGH